MKVIYNRILPFPGFEAINLCGRVFARRECRPVSRRTLRHEAIHTAQMRETAYLGFYLIYAAEWLYHLIHLRSRMQAYFAIRFEREAYRHQDDPHYLLHRRPYAWCRIQAKKRRPRGCQPPDIRRPRTQKKSPGLTSLGK